MADSNITKRALAQAMKKLMAKEPFSKISVGDICEACGMNRKSFYYHFRDKYDLVNWIFYTEFIETIHLPDYKNGWELMEDICQYFCQERDFYRSALQIRGQNSFCEYFSQVVGPFLQAFAADLFLGLDDAQVRFYVTFFSDAFLLAIIRWLTSDIQIPTEDFLRQCRSIIVYLARQALADLDGGTVSG